MNRKEHWENVYRTKEVDQVSWYRDHLENSLQLIRQTNVGKNAAIIDVGGGGSTLVDDLLTEGFTDVTVLDISAAALERSRTRLDRRAHSVHWIEGDITQIELPADHYDVWHDRAVFHFLTNRNDRRKYIDLVKRSLKVGGHIIIASFGLNGPKKCSGLDVVQYSPDSMRDEFGKSFELVKGFPETHRTPFQSTQEFIYCYCRLIKDQTPEVKGHENKYGNHR